MTVCGVRFLTAAPHGLTTSLTCANAGKLGRLAELAGPSAHLPRRPLRDSAAISLTPAGEHAAQLFGVEPRDVPRVRRPRALAVEKLAQRRAHQRPVRGPRRRELPQPRRQVGQPHRGAVISEHLGQVVQQIPHLDRRDRRVRLDRRAPRDLPHRAPDHLGRGVIAAVVIDRDEIPLHELELSVADSGDQRRAAVPAGPQLRRPDARMPAANDPSPRKPSFDLQLLTAKQQFTETSSTSFGGMASLRLDWVSNQSVIAVFRARFTVLVASSAAISPYSGWPNSSWHSLNRPITGRMSGCASARPRVTFFAPSSASLPSRRPTSSYSSCSRSTAALTVSSSK